MLARSTVAILVTCTLAACARSTEPPPDAVVAAPATDAVRVAAQASPVIEFVMPKPNSVGKTPERFEWTPVAGADNYSFGLWTEFDMNLVKMDGIQATAVTWPKDAKPLDPGTYYWSVSAFAGNRDIATSGLAAFVVQ